MNKLIATLLLVLTCAGLAYSGIVARPTKTTGGTSYTDGTVPHASDFNGDFDTIYGDYNGNITNANIAAGAAIAASKILTNFTTNLQVATAAVPCFVNIDTSLGADLKQWRLCQNGSTLSIATYTDAGAAIITPLSIARATGIITTAGGIVISSGNLSLTTGTITATALTAKSFLFSGVGGLLSTTTAPTNGQMLIGNTGNSPSVGTITGTATHICATTGAGTFSLDFCANPAITSPVFSGTATGSLTGLALTNAVLTTSSVAADPTTALGTASKQYVDNSFGGYTAYSVAGAISSNDRMATISGTSKTMTLPTATAGKTLTIVHNGNSLSQVYTIDPLGAQTIDGTLTYDIFTRGEKITIVGDGSSWTIVSHFSETEWTDAGAMDITGTTSDPTKPSSTDVDKVYWRRDGNQVFLRYVLQTSSAAGSAAGSGNYLFALPTNISFDSTVITPVTTVLTSGTRSEAAISMIPSFASAVNVDSVSFSIVSLYAYDTTHFQAWRTDLADAVGPGGANLTNAELSYNFMLSFRAANWRL